MNAPLSAQALAQSQLAQSELAQSKLAEPILAVTGLTKDFPGRRVLRGLAFSLAPGQATALIGANGSGKSTLLRCLVRLIEPTGGEIRMLGRDVLSLAPADLRRFRSEVGIVWQRHNLVPRLSALSNVIHGVQARRSGAAHMGADTCPRSSARRSDGLSGPCRSGRPGADAR